MSIYYMISFIWSSTTGLIKPAGKKKSEEQLPREWKGQRLTKRNYKGTFQGESNVLYLDWAWTQVHAFVRTHWMHKICVVHFMQLFLYTVYKFHIKNCRQMKKTIMKAPKLNSSCLLMSIINKLCINKRWYLI